MEGIICLRASHSHLSSTHLIVSNRIAIPQTATLYGGLIWKNSVGFRNKKDQGMAKCGIDFARDYIAIIQYLSFLLLIFLYLLKTI